MLKSQAHIVGILALFCLLAGCGPAAKNVTAHNAPEAQPRYADEEYRIRVGDGIDVKFFYNPELNDQVTVRPDGRISLQLVHDVPAAGQTASELNESLKKRYEHELTNPELSVIVRSFAGRKVYVDGEVNNPGSYDMVGQMTLRQFIAQAGGVKETARGDEIIVIRQNSTGGLVVMTANMQNINNGTDLAENIKIAPNDIIFVPRSNIANMNLWMKQHITNMVPLPVAPPIPF